MTKQLPETSSFYRQVKNPNPKFIPEEGKKTLPFCEKIREKATGFTQRTEFQTLVAMSIARGERKRRPPKLRISALEASLQALCHYYNPLANRVGASLTTMSIRCGLATEKKTPLDHPFHRCMSDPQATETDYLQYRVRQRNRLQYPYRHHLHAVDVASAGRL